MALIEPRPQLRRYSPLVTSGIFWLQPAANAASAAQSASRSPVTPRLLVLMDLTSSASMGRLRPSAKRLELLSLAGSGRLELGHQVVGRRDLELARGLDV